MRKSTWLLPLMAGFAAVLSLPLPEEELRILGSSVVTSVSIVQENGTDFYTDPAGRPVAPPSVATDLGSPVSLATPDRYQFYTFDKEGHLIRRYMTAAEVKTIIASGQKPQDPDDPSPTFYHNLPGNPDDLAFEPSPRPQQRPDEMLDVVQSVQNVLKNHVVHKPLDKEAFVSPDAAATWSMILPSYLGGGAQQEEVATSGEVLEASNAVPAMENGSSSDQKEAVKKRPVVLAVGVDHVVDVPSYEVMQADAPIVDPDSVEETHVESTEESSEMIPVSLSSSVTETASSSIPVSLSSSVTGTASSSIPVSLSSSVTGTASSSIPVVPAVSTGVTEKTEDPVSSSLPASLSSSVTEKTEHAGSSSIPVVPPLSSSVTEKTEDPVSSSLPVVPAYPGEMADAPMTDNRDQEERPIPETPEAISLNISSNTANTIDTKTNSEESSDKESSPGSSEMIPVSLTYIVTEATTSGLPVDSTDAGEMADAPMINNNVNDTTLQQFTPKPESPESLLINMLLGLDNNSNSNDTQVVFSKFPEKESSEETSEESGEESSEIKPPSLSSSVIEKTKDPASSGVPIVPADAGELAVAPMINNKVEEANPKPETPESFLLGILDWGTNSNDTEASIISQAPDEQESSEESSESSTEKAPATSLAEQTQHVAPDSLPLAPVESGETTDAPVKSQLRVPSTPDKIMTGIPDHHAQAISLITNNLLLDDKPKPTVGPAESFVTRPVDEVDEPSEAPDHTTPKHNLTVTQDLAEALSTILSTVSEAVIHSSTVDDLSTAVESISSSQSYPTSSEKEEEGSGSTATESLSTTSELVEDFTTTEQVAVQRIPVLHGEKVAVHEIIVPEEKARLPSKSKPDREEIEITTSASETVYESVSMIEPSTPSLLDEAATVVAMTEYSTEGSGSGLGELGGSTERTDADDTTEVKYTDAATDNVNHKDLIDVYDYVTSKNERVTNSPNSKHEFDVYDYVTSKNKPAPPNGEKNSDDLPDDVLKYAEGDIDIGLVTTPQDDAADATTYETDVLDDQPDKPLYLIDVLHYASGDVDLGVPTTPLSDKSEELGGSQDLYDVEKYIASDADLGVTMPVLEEVQNDANQDELFDVNNYAASNVDLGLSDPVDRNEIATEIGDSSTEIGNSSTETGDSSTEIGNSSTETGDSSTEIGNSSTETGDSFTETGSSATKTVESPVEKTVVKEEPSEESVTEKAAVAEEPSETGDDIIELLEESSTIPPQESQMQNDQPADSAQLISSDENVNYYKAPLAGFAEKQPTDDDNKNWMKVPVINSQLAAPLQLPPAPSESLGLEASTAHLFEDVQKFADLCNALAFEMWRSVASAGRSVVTSPFGVTSMLSMIFLGAKGPTSGQMNDVLRLDDMMTFNPHQVFRNVTDSVLGQANPGVGAAAFVREIYSDKAKGKMLEFYKQRATEFYNGHVEEVDFSSIGDTLRRRTNLLVKRQTGGLVSDYMKGTRVDLQPPLAAFSANVFQTDCSGASSSQRDGEMYFTVLPASRQRRLIPVPAVVYRSGFMAGYDPSLDATVVSLGDQATTVTTLFVLPGQQGQLAPGDGLSGLETRLLQLSAWSKLLRSLLPRTGLEVQIPRFLQRSQLNVTEPLRAMGLNDLFDPASADLKGLGGSTSDLHVSDVIQLNVFATCGGADAEGKHHVEGVRRARDKHVARPRRARVDQALFDDLAEESVYKMPLALRPRQARLPDALTEEPARLRFDRPFLYFVRHNPTGFVLHMGRFNPRFVQ